jgi:hypothetical protein
VYLALIPGIFVSRFGLSAPEKLPMLAAVACFVIGGLLLLGALLYFVWRKRATVARDRFYETPFRQKKSFRTFSAADKIK